MHSRTQIVEERLRHINHRRYIVETVYGSKVEYWGGLGALSKGKVHCSCPICSEKTRDDGIYSKGHKLFGKNWKHSDKKKILKFFEIEY